MIIIRIYLNKEEIEAIRNWIECPVSLKEKMKLQDVFLVEVYNTSNNARQYEIYDQPQQTNMSGEIRISGWLGTTNNINRTALGRFSSIPDAIASIPEEIEPASEFDDDYFGEEHLLYIGIPLPKEEEKE